MLFGEKSAFNETDADGIVWFRRRAACPNDAPSKTVPIFMRPTGVRNCLPMPSAMTEAWLPPNP